MEYSPNINIPKPSSGDVNQIFEQMTRQQRRPRGQQGPPPQRQQDPRNMEYNPNIPMTKMAHQSSGYSRTPEYDPFIAIPGTSQRRPLGAVTTNMAHPSSGHPPTRMRHQSSGFETMTFMAHESSGRNYRKIRPSGQQKPMRRPQGPSGPSGRTRVQCDGCGANPIVGPRYKCRNCPNYDLCRKCNGTRHLHHQFVVIPN